MWVCKSMMAGGCRIGVASALVTLGAVFIAAGCNATIGEAVSGAPIDAAPATDAGAQSVDAADLDAPPPCMEGDDRIVDMMTGTCYFVMLSAAIQADAVIGCAAKGGTLVEINTLAEQLIVADLTARNIDALLIPPRVDFWIGGTDTAAEGTWSWPSGTDFWTGGAKDMGGMPVNNAFENWRTGEPNNSISRDPNGEDCMATEGDLPAHTWDDRPCGDTIAYVCEL